MEEKTFPFGVTLACNSSLPYLRSLSLAVTLLICNTVCALHDVCGLTNRNAWKPSSWDDVLRQSEEKYGHVGT